MQLCRLFGTGPWSSIGHRTQRSRGLPGTHLGRRPKHSGGEVAAVGECGTIVAMSTESLRTVRDRFSDFVERVNRQHERIVITRNGTPAAVLVSPEDLESLEETLAVLADPDALEAIAQAEREVTDGDVIRGYEALKALRPR